MNRTDTNIAPLFTNIIYPHPKLKVILKYFLTYLISPIISSPVLYFIFTKRKP